MNAQGLFTAGGPRRTCALGSLARAKLTERDAPAAARLPFAAQIDREIIRTRDGAHFLVIAFDGFNAETVDEATIAARKALRDLALRSLGSSEWALWHHHLRRRVTLREPDAGGSGYVAALNGRYRAALNRRGLFEDRHFLTLLRRPLQGKAGLIEDIARAVRRGSDGGAPKAETARAIAALREAADALTTALAPHGPRILTSHASAQGLRSEPAAFLAGLVNGRMAEAEAMLLPAQPLSAALPERRIIVRHETIETRGIESRDVERLACLSIKAYPQRTFPGMLDGLATLPHEFTLTQSFALVDAPEAIGRMRGVQGRMRGAEDSVSLAAALSEAADDVAAGRSVFGRHHLTVFAKAKDQSALDAALADIQAVFSEAGVIAVREDVGLEAAFWAQLPGNGAYIARHALISSGNFAGLAALHGAPRRAERGHWPKPVLACETMSGAPMPLHLHVGDLGHTTIIGPSGSGKTVLIGALIAQSAAIPDRRVIVFDKDRGLEIAVRAMGGLYARLAHGASPPLNPLHLKDTPANRAFLALWLSLLTRNGAEGAQTPRDAAVLADAVAANFAAPKEARRLQHLAALLAGHERQTPGSLADRLARWHGAGGHAWMFDHGDDALDLNAAITGFDLTEALDDPIGRAPLLLYLFHRIEQALDGRPTLLILDEGWRLLDDPIFEARIKDWQKTLRKKNAALVFATQSAEDAARSPIAPAIIGQSASQIFFPNLKAERAAHCDAFGLTEAECRLVKDLAPESRGFLFKQGGTSQLARLDLGGLSDDLAILSGRAETLRILDRVLEDARSHKGADAADNPALWLPLFHATRKAGATP